jgi:HPt (histidine-containing phosphotransfer) domain-containing protein
MGVDSAFAQKVIRLFVNESRNALAEIERAAAVADIHALRDAAHRLKSSAASVGAGVLADIAGEVEVLARTGQAVALDGHPARLRLAYECFCTQTAIRNMLLPEFLERNVA